MNKTQHTPTPWTQCADSYNRLAIQGADGSFVADMIHEYDAPAAENAAFIVRACNAHDDLVAALTKIAEWDHPSHPIFENAPVSVDALAAIARAALAKAGISTHEG